MKNAFLKPSQWIFLFCMIALLGWGINRIGAPRDDGKYLMQTYEGMVEFAKVAGTFPDASEIEWQVADPDYSKWLTQNRSRIRLPLAGQPWDPSMDSAVIAVELIKPGGNSIRVSVGGSAKAVGPP